MWKTLIQAVRKIIAVLSLILLPIYFLSIFLTVDGYVLAFKSSPPESIFYRVFYFPMYIGPIPFYIPIYMVYTPRLSELMLLLLTIYTICLTSTIFKECNILRALKWGVNPFKNAFISTTALTNASILLILLIQFIQEKAGIETGEIKAENELLKYISIALAPLIEEIGFRIFLIGIISLIITIVILGIHNLRIKEIIEFLLFPRSARKRVYMETGKDSLRIPLILLVIITSIIFGVIHYLYGGGWEIGKISTATIAGLLLGYLYVVFGIDASILSHYTFNHFLMTYYYISRVNKLVGLIDFIILVQGFIAIIYGIIIIIVRGWENEVSINGPSSVSEV